MAIIIGMVDPDPDPEAVENIVGMYRYLGVKLSLVLPLWQVLELSPHIPWGGKTMEVRLSLISRHVVAPDMVDLVAKAGGEARLAIAAPQVQTWSTSIRNIETRG